MSRATRPADSDLVVVIPGLLGSTLYRGDDQLWGYRQLAATAGDWTRRWTRDLALPEGALADPEVGFDDGVEARSSLRTLVAIPGFWRSAGYSRLMSWLRSTFPTDSVIDFPYDWRQSCLATARKLQRWIEPQLQAHRRTWPNARLVFVGHSLGGLVARWYAETLDTNHFTRRVITIGTPYSGAVKAVGVLHNETMRLGPFSLSIGDLVRTLPSVAEVLPTYPCVLDAADAASTSSSSGPPLDLLRRLDDESMPGLRGQLAHARRMRELLDAAALRNADPPSYHPIVGYAQPTPTWLHLDRGDLHMHSTTDWSSRGDGTVPRWAAVPGDWDDARYATAEFVAGTHSTFQESRAVLESIRGRLTVSRRPQSFAPVVGFTVPECVEPEQMIDVVATADDEEGRLLLEASLVDDRGVNITRTRLRFDPDRGYVAQLRAPSLAIHPGAALTIEVSSPRFARVRTSPTSEILTLVAT